MSGHERRYSMIRLEAGDYVCPSNDLRTLWRVRVYDEDGSATRGDGTVVLGRRWSVSSLPMDKWNAAEHVESITDVDALDWWFYSDGHTTRAAAIRDVPWEHEGAIR